MPRKRMISPEIWRDPKFVSLSDDTTRLLFIGLFSNANDYGKLRGEWWNIRSEIFVLSELSQNKIRMMLEELEKKKLIIRYKANNEQYIKLTRWQSHQKVSHPAKDQYPEPSKDNPPEDLRRTSGDLPSQCSLVQIRLDKEKRSKEAINPPTKVDLKMLVEAKKELEKSCNKNRIIKWLKKIRPVLHSDLRKFLDKTYPQGHSYQDAKQEHEDKK